MKKIIKLQILLEEFMLQTRDTIAKPLQHTELISLGGSEQDFEDLITILESTKDKTKKQKTKLKQALEGLKAHYTINAFKEERNKADAKKGKLGKRKQRIGKLKAQIELTKLRAKLGFISSEIAKKRLATFNKALQVKVPEPKKSLKKKLPKRKKKLGTEKDEKTRAKKKLVARAKKLKELKARRKK